MGIVIERALDFLMEEEDESNIFPKAEEAQEFRDAQTLFVIALCCKQ